MRPLFSLLFSLLFALLLVLPAPAAEIYENARFGFAIAVPDDFVGQGESANGDGQIFMQQGRPNRLLSWGGFITGQPDFSALAAWTLQQDADHGWAITYQASTPGWASWSGVKGARVLYQRMIALCGEGRYAAFRLEYYQADRGVVDPAIERLVPSLKSTGC